MNYLNMNFNGTANRKEYWGTYILGALVFLIALIFGFTLGGESGGVIVTIVFGLGFLVLSFAVSVRRCRDMGVSPLWVLTLLIPYASIIPFFIFGVIQSEEKQVSILTE